MLFLRARGVEGDVSFKEDTLIVSFKYTSGLICSLRRSDQCFTPRGSNRVPVFSWRRILWGFDDLLRATTLSAVIADDERRAIALCLCTLCSGTTRTKRRRLSQKQNNDF